jgi:cephalosporin-C deacetylase
VRQFACIIIGLLCAWLLAGGIPAGAATPAPEVKITAAKEGGYLVTSPVYSARIGADGNLHGLVVNGVEFFDDRIAGSAGAAFFVERPIPLPQCTLDGLALTATDGVYAVRYDFDEGFITLTLRQTSPKGAAYTVVCSPKVAYAENLAYDGLTAAPANYDWPDVSLSVPTGEFLELRGGTRIWGQTLGRQVWERSNIAPNKDYTLLLVPGRGEPRTPTLSQLTTLFATFVTPEQLLPAAAPVAVRLLFQNNANQAIKTDLVVRVDSSAGQVISEERLPLDCAAHALATLEWTVTPPRPDFYTLTVRATLNGAPKQYVTTFGFDAASIGPAAAQPADFADYWGRIQAEATAGAVKLTRLEDRARSTGTVTVYRIGLETEGFTCFGWLAVPKFPGRYPGLLLIPGERVRTITPNAALADCGFVVMTIEPTGQGVDGAIKPLIGKAFTNLHDSATVGLRAVTVRYLQALDALATVPEVDTHRLAVTGVSLGGALAMLLAAQDERVQAVAPDVPYFCFIEQGKDAADWPYAEVQAYLKSHPAQQEAVWATLRYFDVGNAVEKLTCPTLISAGINDTISRPANIYGLYNRLPGPKALKLYLAGHEGGGPSHWAEKVKWLGQVLGGPGPAAPAAKPEAPKAENP